MCSEAGREAVDAAVDGVVHARRTYAPVEGPGAASSGRGQQGRSDVRSQRWTGWTRRLGRRRSPPWWPGGTARASREVAAAAYAGVARGGRPLVVAVVVALAGALLALQLRPGHPCADAARRRPGGRRAASRKAQEEQPRRHRRPPSAYQAALPSLVHGRDPRRAGDGSSGTGAGVVVSADGAVLTALHVVDGAAAHRGDASPTAPRSSAQRRPRRTRRRDIAVLTASTAAPGRRAGGARRRRRRSATQVFALGHPFGLTRSLSRPAWSRRSTARSRSTDGRTLDGPHPVRRRGQPRQLRRPAAQPGRAGRRHRHRPGQPVRAELLRRHRLRRAHRHRRRRRRQRHPQ